ncbi:hypothetical protein B0H11DRAFT_2280302, partial [Mycena galericulata]
MSFISNADNFTLGDGVYNNVHGNIVHNNFYIENAHRRVPELDGEKSLRLKYPAAKRRRRQRETDGVKIIRNKQIKLTCEIGSGPGYCFHAGEYKGRATIVKVFNADPTMREASGISRLDALTLYWHGQKRLEWTLALSEGLLHPNVLRIEGISSPTSSTHFLVYESVGWKNAEGPLAAALKENLPRSITLGFKLIAGLSSGIDYLRLQGIFLGSMGAENFDLLLDTDDRFLLSMNPHFSDGNNDDSQDPEDKACDILNALLRKAFKSAKSLATQYVYFALQPNISMKLGTDESIDRNPVTLDSLHRPSLPPNTSALDLHSSDMSPPQIDPDQQAPVILRREYVLRKIERGQESLAAIAHRITLDLDIKISSVHKVKWTDVQSPHRCPGYVREEITLAAMINDSAVVSHNTPSPLETCPVCHEVVGFHESFKCVCGASDSGSRHTVKCRVCMIWSHSDCVGQPKEFTCQTCLIVTSPTESVQPLGRQGYTTRRSLHGDSEEVSDSKAPQTVATVEKEKAAPMIQAQGEGFRKAFRCVCGHLNHGFRDTVKCQICVGHPKESQHRIPPFGSNFIERLNNYFQAKKASHTVSWIESFTGPSHDIKWTVVCKLAGKALGTGVADSRAAAKDEAARRALSASRFDLKLLKLLRLIFRLSFMRSRFGTVSIATVPSVTRRMTISLKSFQNSVPHDPIYL